MKRWIIDRFEGDYAVCEGKEGETLLVDKDKLPQGSQAGSVLYTGEDGSFLLDIEETRRRRAAIREKLRRLLGEE